MSKTLTDIAKQLKDTYKKVQLIYAFNGTGKTRLLQEFKQLVTPKLSDDSSLSRNKILYYSAFTEDLFFWDNDLEGDRDRKLLIQSNSFTSWLFNFLKEQGQDGNITKNFQRLTHSKITPQFNQDFSEITFSIERGGNDTIHNLKISKGEESNFIWSVFYTFLEEVVSILDEDPDNRSRTEFDNIEYIVIDDPVSSLDDNHLIEVAIDLVRLIKSTKANIRFVVFTHNALFYNAFYNTFKRDEQRNNGILNKYTLRKIDNGLYLLIQHNENSQFSYHLHIKEEIEMAISNSQVKKYHFNFLRNILERTTIFLGHSKWQDLLPEKYKDKVASYEERMINISSHSDYAAEEVVDLNSKAAEELIELMNAINLTYNFKKNKS
ncbi:AAA family ATPase [Leptospira yasudae]|uniref:AAA family ATPase n=1 Tax=Leptospira yasudae TaxID=2202201 RepID=UPI001C4EDD6A|nr:AAA family ATPase [Leptospira yasudae]MBW0435676.1 AAA family ATPase [Leptospira yasudae]